MKIYFDNVLIDEDAYADLTNDYKLFTDNFYLGSTASNTFKITIAKTEVSSHPSEVKITDDTNTYYLIVDKVTEEKNFYIYELVDKLVLFNFNYDASVLINERAEDELTTTLTDILTDMCSKVGIEIDENLTLINDITITWYDNSLLARDYLGYIAELQGGFARILDDGKLTIVKQKTTSKATLQIDNCEDFLLGEKKTISRVVYDNGIVKYEYGDETANTLYINPNNVYITDTTIVENIYNEVVGLEFYLLETGRCQLDPSVRAGDIITFTDGVNSYLTIAQYSMSYAGGWAGGYQLQVNTERQQETQVTRTSQQVRNIQTKVDRLNNEFSVIAEEIEKLTDYIRNVGTTGDYLMLPDTPRSGGAINTLSIKGFELMPLYHGMAYLSEYTYPGALNFYTLVFDIVNTFDNNPHYIYVNSPIPLQKLGSVYDELLIESNKVKVIQRIGYDFDNEQWSVLSTPITHELNDVLLPTFEGDTYISVRYFDNLVYSAEYLIKNDLTSNFATQLESSSQFKLNQDEISSKVNNDEFSSTVTQLADGISSKVSKGEIVSEINQSEEQVKIEAQKIKLEGLTTINNNFKVLMDGSIEANNGLFKGDVQVGSTNLVDKNLGVYTMIEVVREELVGQMHWQQGGGTIFEARGIELRFYIPANFTITEAKILLKQYRTRHSNSYPWQTDIDGKLTTVNLYKGTVNRFITITQDFDSVDFGSSSHGTVVSAFGGYTAPNFYENSVMSSDIKAHITSGDNYFYISNGSTFETFDTPMQEAQYKALLNARLPKSAFASATLMIYGYIK